jgi:hypothetical protein
MLSNLIQIFLQRAAQELGLLTEYSNKLAQSKQSPKRRKIAQPGHPVYGFKYIEADTLKKLTTHRSM